MLWCVGVHVRICIYTCHKKNSSSEDSVNTYVLHGFCFNTVKDSRYNLSLMSKCMQTILLSCNLPFPGEPSSPLMTRVTHIQPMSPFCDTDKSTNKMIRKDAKLHIIISFSCSLLHIFPLNHSNGPPQSNR